MGTAYALAPAGLNFRIGPLLVAVAMPPSLVVHVLVLGRLDLLLHVNVYLSNWHTKLANTSGCEYSVCPGPCSATAESAEEDVYDCKLTEMSLT